MKKYALALLALLLLLPAVLASGEALDVAVPEYVRPYAPAEITVTCPDAGELTLRVSDDYVSYVIATTQAQAGENRIAWDGLGDNAEALQRGAYTLTVTLQTERDTYVSETPLTVKLAAAALQYLIPSGDTVYAGQDGFLVNYLITASGTGALLWAKQIIERLGVFRADTLEAWHAYFSSGEARHFFALMQSLPERDAQ